jgi:hypothetical protein
LFGVEKKVQTFAREVFEKNVHTRDKNVHGTQNNEGKNIIL